VAESNLDVVLVDLGTRLAVPPPPEDLQSRVMARLASTPARSRLRRWFGWALTRLRRLWRWVVAGLLVLVVSLGAVPPVRAQVSSWLSFLGVVVRAPAPGSPVPTVQPSPPPASAGLTLSQAAALVRFRPVVPAELGLPAAVEVSGDRRLLSLSWQTSTGTVRLDQFDGRLSPRFVKTSRDAEYVEVGDTTGLWFPTAHEVVVIDRPGTQESRELPPRLAAQTLVWEESGTTVRLEGRLTRDRAVQIARSAG